MSSNPKGAQRRGWPRVVRVLCVVVAVVGTVWTMATPVSAQEATDEDPRLAAAERALSESRLGDAASSYGEALEAARSGDKDAVTEGRALAGLGAVALTRRQFDAADSHLKAAAEVFEGAGETGWLGVVRYQQGNLERARDDVAAAREAFTAAARAFESVGSIDGERALAIRWHASALVALGEVVQPQDPDEAADHFDEAADLYKKIDATLDEADARYLKGIAEHTGGDFRRADRELKEALRLYRDGDDARWVAITQLARGQVLADAGDPEAASGYFKNAIDGFVREDGARNYELAARLGFASVQARVGETSAAIGEYAEAARLAEALDAADWRAAVDVGHGHALLAGGRADEAITRFEAVVAYAGGEALASQRGESLLALGEIQLSRGEFDAALSRYDAALELESMLGDSTVIAAARLGRGEVLLARGEVDAAETALQAAIKDLPGSALPERSRGLAALARDAAARGRSDAAHSLFDDAVEGFEDSGELTRLGETLRAEARLFVSEGDVRRAEDRLEDAVEALRRAGARRLQAEARVELAAVGVVRGDRDGAMENYERAGDAFSELEMARKAGHAYLESARLYREDRKQSEALAVVRRSLEHLEREPVAADDAETTAQVLGAVQLMAELHEELDQPDEAIVAFERAVSLATSQENDALRMGDEYRLGELLRDADRFDEAIPHYEQAIAVASRTGAEEMRAEALMGLGLVYYAKNDERAVKTLETAKEVFHELGSAREGVARRHRGRAYSRFGIDK